MDSPPTTRHHRLMPDRWFDCMVLVATAESPLGWYPVRSYSIPPRSGRAFGMPLNHSSSCKSAACGRSLEKTAPISRGKMAVGDFSLTAMTIR
jgi:hypothetical protein